MRQYRVPRGVVREALDLLRSDGLVDRFRGYGTVVIGSPRANPLIDSHGIEHVPHGGFWEDITHTTLLSRRTVPTPDAVSALMPGAGSVVLELDYLAHSGDDVVTVATNYFAYPQAERLETLDFGLDFYEFVQRAGIAVGATEFSLSAATVDPVMAQTIGTRVGAPIIHLEQTVFDMEGRAFDVAYIWLRADRVMLTSFAAHPDFPGRVDR